MRAKAMAHFDMAIPHAATSIKELKDKGKKVVGYYCVFAPQELAVAAGAVPVALCATKEEPIADGEKVLPRNFCPLIKSSYGFAITDKCPFFLHSDFIVGETTCDGKKKMFELMGKFKPMVVLAVPQGAQGEAAREYWTSEVRRCKKELEERLGTSITDEGIRAAIEELNAERALIRRIAELMKAKPAPLTGQDMLKVMWARNFVFDRQEFMGQARELIADLEDMVSRGEGVTPANAKRILVTGVPTGLGAEKVLRILEESGAAVVYLENCSGMKQYLFDVFTEEDPLQAVADKYLATPCSCMSPNTTRMELIEKLIGEYAIDGVVDITWVGCHTYNVESRVLREHLKETTGTPMLQIETDYSQGDSQQIKVRVEAFLEMLR